jgi:YgiT-type zinc finger domain-containing protein
MTDGPGSCPLCGAEKRSGVTTFAVDLGFGVVVVRDVPALVCTQCGDAWIADSVAARLEDVVEDARRRRAEVEVAHWQQVAA